MSREDGMGVAPPRKAGVPVLILSTETTPWSPRAARKLGVPVLQGVGDKAAALRRAGSRRRASTRPGSPTWATT